MGFTSCHQAFIEELASIEEAGVPQIYHMALESERLAGHQAKAGIAPCFSDARLIGCDRQGKPDVSGTGPGVICNVLTRHKPQIKPEDIYEEYRE